MIKPADHKNEKERLEDLQSYSILDTLSETNYDDITAIAAEICGTEISLISLIDDKRQWLKSAHGIDLKETPRENAFCAHAINDQENVFIVQDARSDERFHDNPLVTGETSLVFYAGVPLVSDNGLPLGALCVIDKKPKLLSQTQVKSLKALGRQVMHILNLRKTKSTLEKTLENLEEKNLELERFAFLAAHDLKSPLNNINGLSQLFLDVYGSEIDEEGKEMISLITSSSNKLGKLIDGLLEYSKSETILNEKKSNINLKHLIEDISGLFAYEHQLELQLNSSITEISVNKTVLEQVLINLITNAIKYNDKEQVEIEIGVTASATHYKFYVQDNGPGIALENQNKIFEMFEVLGNKDKFGKKGNGIGLATLKKVVEHSGGRIKVTSEPKKGARFIFTLKK
jgi:signal transduction histidine kinase